MKRRASQREQRVEENNESNKDKKLYRCLYEGCNLTYKNKTSLSRHKRVDGHHWEADRKNRLRKDAKDQDFREC